MQIQTCESFNTPICHQLPPMPHEGCLLIPQEIESGWEPVPKDVPEKTTPKKHWVMTYFKGNEKTGYTCYPPWMRLFEPLKLPKCPEPIIEAPAKTIARMTEHIEKQYSLDERNSDLRDRYVGSKLGKYCCVATSANRALLVHGASAPDRKRRKPWPVCSLPDKDSPYFLLEDPNIMLGLMRLATLSKGEKVHSIRFTWIHETGQLLLTSKNIDEGQERYSCTATASGTFLVDPNYIIPILGSWPLAIFFTGELQVLRIMPQTRKPEFLYLLAPMQE